MTEPKATVLSYLNNVSSSPLKDALLVGTPDQVADLRERGLRYLVVSNLSILQPSLRKGLTATLPIFTILRD